MQEVNATTLALPEARRWLDEILRQGVQKLLARAVEAEVAQWFEWRQDLTDSDGCRQMVRNG